MTALGPEYLVFETDRGYGYHPDSIGIVPGHDTLDMLRVMGTRGVNYDTFNDSVLAQVRRWHDSLAFRLEAAGGDWMEASFSRPPDYDALAREVYAFCPDVVDQGTNTVEVLAKEIRESGKLYCWWD